MTDLAQNVRLSIDNRQEIRQPAPMTTIAPPQDRQDAILDAAFHAFAGDGYRRASMEDIARVPGLSRTALYLHFRNKEDIFRSLSWRYFQECLAALRDALTKDGPAETVLTVTRSGVGLAAIGAALGAALAIPASSLVAASLYGVAERDPLTYAAAAVFLLVVAAVASLVPAWRLLRLDPAVTLRMGQ